MDTEKMVGFAIGDLLDEERRRRTTSRKDSARGLQRASYAAEGYSEKERGVSRRAKEQVR
jgi:hypothetical protein